MRHIRDEKIWPVWCKSIFSSSDSARKRFCHEEDDIVSVMQTEVVQICNIAVEVAHFLCIFIEFIPLRGILSKLAVTIDNSNTTFEDQDHRK